MKGSHKDRIIENSDSQLNKVLFDLGLLETKGIPDGYFSADTGQLLFLSQVGLLDYEKALIVLSEKLALRIAHIDQVKKKEYFQLLEKEPLSSISIDKWVKDRVLPVALDNESLTLAMVNPLDTELVMELSFTLDRRVVVMMAREAEVMEVLLHRLRYGEGFSVEEFFDNEEPDENDFKIEKKGKHSTHNFAPDETEEDFDSPDAAPVVRLVNKIFNIAVKMNASDVHIDPEKNLVPVKVRVDGILREILTIPKKYQLAVVSRIKLMSKMDIAEHRLPQDGKFRLKTTNGAREVRVSTVPSHNGENIVARILSSNLNSLEFSNIGIRGQFKSLLERGLLSSSKVILVTGPTGSGKTSTLYASLLKIRSGSKSIVTLEDPIEYRLPGITQIQINTKIGLSFSCGLRAVLRQDPDVILVGEIRDKDTAEVVVQTAQTGHLVLSTLHTNSATAAVTRLVDLGIAPYMIASSVELIVSQRLVRKLCQHCAVATPLSDLTQAVCEERGLDSSNVREASGCAECNFTGYSGRIPVLSLLPISNDVAAAIRNEASEEELAALGERHGYKSLHEAALELVGDGLVPVDEVQRVLGPFPLQHSTRSRVSTDNNSVMHKPYILVVEDDEDFRFLLTSMLETEMYEVASAENGRQALESIYKRLPDIVLSDVMMPEMNGYKFIQKLRADKRLSDIPVLMLTAESTEENELRLMTSGADDFVAKTTSSDIILARVQRLLRHLSL